MPMLTVLFHYGWRRPGLIQAGPALSDGPSSVAVPVTRIAALQAALCRNSAASARVLLHYTDPFLLRA